MSAAPHELPDDIAELKAIIIDLHRTLATKEETIAGLKHNVHLLAKWAFGPKSERRPTGKIDTTNHQGSLLFPEIIEAAERVADQTGATGEVELKTPERLEASKPAAAPRKKGGRRNSFPEHLPVVRTTFELPEEARTCACCGQNLQVIGEEVTRELERVEFTVVHEIARKKYACKRCPQGVKTAAGPDRVFDRGLLGTGFLAHLIAERFGNHMPYHRLERKYESEGLDLSRSVLCDAAKRVAELLAPIYRKVREEVLESGVVQTDDTGVLRLDRQKRHADRCEMWTYRAMDGQVFYDFADVNSRDGPDEVLKNFTGYLQADAHRRYEQLYKSGNIVEVGCWAHARRRFVEAEATEPDLAKQAVDLIRELYAIERRAKEEGLSAEQWKALRQKESVPQLAKIQDWLTATLPKVLEQGPLGKAIKYAQKKWDALTRYVEDGRLDIDNNGAERALRAVAVGRKNWTFLGNEKGGKTAAVLYSLVMSAKAAGVDPRAYLRDVLLRIGKCSDVGSLTPKGWKDRWLPVVEAHRKSIIERLLTQAP